MQGKFSPYLSALGSIVPMYPLTPHGIGEAVVEMNYQRKYAKR